jgi:Tfp pilus assembly protein PilN
VRPVNLIPPDQRKGAARAAGEATPVGVYVLLGTLGVALLAVVAMVLTTNSVNSKTEELSKVKAEEQGVKEVADALRPYGTFAQISEARQTEISALTSSRFNWERALRQLSRTIPDDVWLLNIGGSVAPGIDVSDAGGGGNTSALREKANAPAFTMTGCTFSQHAVARMMTRMQNLDDVTDVQLAKSARKDDQDQGGGGAVTQTADPTQASDSADCVGNSRITKFDLLVVFGGAPGAAVDAGTNAGASAPPPLAQSQNAAAAAVTQSGGTTP